MAGKVLKNSYHSALTGVLNTLANFASSILIARLLGIEGAGIVAYNIWLVTIAVTVFDLGFHSTLARYLPDLSSQGRFKAAEKLTRDLFIIYVGTMLAFMVLAFGSIGLWDHGSITNSWSSVGRPAIVLALCVCSILGNFAFGQLRGAQKFGFAAKLSAISFLLQTVGVLVGALLWGASGALIGYGLGSLPLAIASLEWMGRRGASGLTISRRVLVFAAYTWGGGLASAFVWNRAEIFFLERSYGPHAVGLFTVGLTFANLASQGPMLLTGALLAFFSEKVASGSQAGAEAAFQTATRFMALISLPLCFGAAAILPALMPMVYGHSFDAAELPAAIIVCTTSLGAIGTVGTSLLYSRDRSDFLFWSTVAGAGLSITSGLVIIPTFGLIGAAVGRGAVYIFMVSLGAWFISTRLRCAIPFRDLGKLTLAAAICGITARVLLLCAPPGLGLGISIVGGAIAYGLFIRIFDVLPAGDVARLSQIFEQLPPLFGRVGSMALKAISPRAIVRVGAPS